MQKRAKSILNSRSYQSLDELDIIQEQPTNESSDNIPSNRQEIPQKQMHGRVNSKKSLEGCNIQLKEYRKPTPLGNRMNLPPLKKDEIALNKYKLNLKGRYNKENIQLPNNISKPPIYQNNPVKQAGKAILEKPSYILQNILQPWK